MNDNSSILNLIIRNNINNDNEIFNYKIDVITQDELIIEDNSYITKREKYLNKINNQINYNPQKEEMLFLCRKSFKTKNYEILNPLKYQYLMKKKYISPYNLKNLIWYPVKPIYNKKYEENHDDYFLNEYDIIKFGRIKYQIIKININKTNNSNNENKKKNENNYNISEVNRKVGNIFDINIKDEQYKIEDVKELNDSEGNDINLSQNSLDLSSDNESVTEDEIVIFAKGQKNENCRICDKNFSSKENPLLSLCKCNDYIHFECLKKYIKKRTEVHESLEKNVTTYRCNKFNCDFCHNPYPLRFKIPKFDKIYELINFPKKNNNYIIMESLNYFEGKNNIKNVHIVDLDGGIIEIGRKTTNDVIDNNLSFSKYQAVIKFNKDNGNLILENKSQKSGTLVLIKGNIKMKKEILNFQVGNLFITAQQLSKNNLK